MGLAGGRKGISIVLYLLAGLGGLLCVLTLVTVEDARRRNAMTGDFAGASLAMSFLLADLLPLTLSTLILALWLAPPDLKRWRGGGPGSAQGSEAPTPSPDPGARRGLGAGFLSAAVALVLVAGWMLAGLLRTAQREYGTQGGELARLALLDALALSPVLLLAGVLGLIGGRLLRRDRGRE